MRGPERLERLHRRKRRGSTTTPTPPNTNEKHHHHHRRSPRGRNQRLRTQDGHSLRGRKVLLREKEVAAAINPNNGARWKRCAPFAFWRAGQCGADDPSAVSALLWNRIRSSGSSAARRGNPSASTCRRVVGATFQRCATCGSGGRTRSRNCVRIGAGKIPKTMISTPSTVIASRVSGAILMGVESVGSCQYIAATTFR